MLLLKAIFEGNDMEYKNIFENQKKFDCARMVEVLEMLSEDYPYIEIGTLGNSFMGRGIPMVALGSGKSSVVYVGAICGREYITSMALIRFIKEYAEGYLRGIKMYNNSLRSLFCDRTVYIIPMLDVDGVEYAINGINDKNTLYDRLSEGKDDFECERGAFCNFVRFNDTVKAIVTLRQQREGISFSGNAKGFVRAMSMAKSFSKITGYAIEGAYDDNDLIFRELDIPQVSVRCTERMGNRERDPLFSIYGSVREILFRTPFMI